MKKLDLAGAAARGALIAAALLLQAAGAQAQAPAPAPKAGPPGKVGAAFANKLAQMPNFIGDWGMTRGIVFDPDHAVLPPDPAGDDGGFGYGPLPGAYMTGIPYKPEYQKKYDETVRKARDEGLVDDPVGNCLGPHGMPREMGGAPGAIEITATPTELWMIFSWFNATRRIYLDGRPHPTGDDMWPMSMGHSIGKWEGDTLVVDTVGMFAGIYDRTGAPHSDKVHLVERMRLTDANTLENQITIEDPVMLTKPWRVTRTFTRRAPNPVQLLGDYCDGGNRNGIVNGAQSAVLATDTQPGVK